MTSKVALILHAFIFGSERSLTEIAQLTRLPLSTAHRYVTELTSYGVLERTDNSQYRAGLPLRIMGSRAEPHRTLDERARSALGDLAGITNADARFGILIDGKVSYIEHQAGNNGAASLVTAAALPAHATAMGKALLAFSPANAVDAVIERGLKRYTPRTLTSPQQLRRALAATRLNYQAVAIGELYPHENTIAAPVFGSHAMVLGAIELKVRDISDDLRVLRPALHVAARGLSRQFDV